MSYLLTCPNCGEREVTDFSFGGEVVPRPETKPSERDLNIYNYFRRNVAGVQREVTLYTAPLAAVGKPDTPWVRICDRADKITAFDVAGDDIYLRTYRDSPRFSIIRTRLSEPSLAVATTVVPASQQVVLGGYAAKDALYVQVRDGTITRLKRLPWNATSPVDVKLPLDGASSL